MNRHRRLMLTIMVKYQELRSLRPEHELLKYCTLDGGGFELASNIDTKVEFMTRFREGTPTLTDLKKPEKIIPFSEYQESLASIVFENYLSVLEQTIKEILAQN